jgi:hypothetical protein
MKKVMDGSSVSHVKIELRVTRKLKGKKGGNERGRTL